MGKKKHAARDLSSIKKAASGLQHEAEVTTNHGFAANAPDVYNAVSAAATLPYGWADLAQFDGQLTKVAFGSLRIGDYFYTNNGVVNGFWLKTGKRSAYPMQVLYHTPGTDLGSKSRFKDTALVQPVERRVDRTPGSQSYSFHADLYLVPRAKLILEATVK